MTGDVVSADQALAMGMINAVAPDAELMPRVLALAEKFAQAPTAADWQNQGATGGECN